MAPQPGKRGKLVDFLLWPKRSIARRIARLHRDGPHAGAAKDFRVLPVDLRHRPRAQHEHQRTRKPRRLNLLSRDQHRSRNERVCPKAPAFTQQEELLRRDHDVVRGTGVRIAVLVADRGRNASICKARKQNACNLTHKEIAAAHDIDDGVKAGRVFGLFRHRLARRFGQHLTPQPRDVLNARERAPRLNPHPHEVVQRVHTRLRHIGISSQIVLAIKQAGLGQEVDGRTGQRVAIAAQRPLVGCIFGSR